MSPLQHRERPPERRDETPQPGQTGEQPDPLASFHSRVATGDYNAVFGRGLRNALRTAAVETDLAAEIGALRLALVRLLQEETNPSRLAAGVARLASVAVQAARLRTSPNAELEEVRSIFLRELEAVEAEYGWKTGRDQAPPEYDPVAPETRDR